jgi:hypothetical protein
MSAFKDIIAFWRWLAALVWFPILLAVPRRVWVRFFLGVFFFAVLTPWAVLRRWVTLSFGGQKARARPGWTEVTYSTSDRALYEGQA